MNMGWTSRLSVPQSWSCDLYALVMLGIFPLLGGDYLHITQGKTLAFLVLSGGFLLGSWIECLVRRPIGRLGLSPVGWCWLTLAFVELLAAVCSPYRPQTWLGGGRSGGLLLLWLYVLVAVVLARYAGLRSRFVYALALATLIQNGVALLQLVGGNPLGLYPEGLTYWDRDLSYAGAYLGTIGNLNQLSAFYCLTIPLLLGQALLERRPSRRWVLVGIAALSLAIPVWTGMEACLVGLGVGLACSLPGLFPRPRSRLWCYGGLLLIGCLVLTGVWFWAGPVESTWWQLHEVLHGQGQDHFGSMRLGIWRAAWSAVQERPWLGWGPDVFRQVYGAMFPTGAVIDAAHNEYLAYWLDGGFFGLLAYGMALALSLVRWMIYSRWDRRFLLPLAATLCYSIQACFTFSTPIVSPLWWILWGLGVGLEREVRPSVGMNTKEIVSNNQI